MAFKPLAIEMYSLPEIATATGASVSTLRNAIKARKLAARKVGREYKCTRSEIYRFLNINELDDRAGVFHE